MTEPTIYEFTAHHKQVSTNNGYKRGKGKGLYKTKALKEFQRAIREEARKMWRDRPIDKLSKWAVEITFYYPSSRNDVDGSIKPVLDALEGIIFENDRRVLVLLVNKARDKSNPRTTIRMRRIANE